MSKNINPDDLSDEEHRAVGDIYRALIQTTNEAIKTHGIPNVLEAISRFTADVLIGTAKYYDHGCPTTMAINFGKVIRRIVADTVAGEAQHD